MNESMDDILKYVEKLTSYVQGEVKVGDYESLSILGSKEQQHLSEISQDISQLFLNQSDEIGSTISISIACSISFFALAILFPSIFFSFMSIYAFNSFSVVGK